MKGNVVDLAIGVIIGASFGKVVSSLVADVAMPPLGLLLGGVDFSGFEITLKSGTPPIVLRYGLFLNSLIDFFIVAITVFFVIKMMNRLHFSSLLAERQCSECLSHIPAKAKRCKYCGSAKFSSH